MNPDTTITKNQIEQLCKLHAIEYVSSGRIEIGFSNEVYAVNGNLVVKFYLPQGRRYEIELAVLKHKTSFPKPDIIAYGKANNIVNRSYIFMSRVPGTPLGHVWHELSKWQREKLVKAYIDAQKEITTFNAAQFGFDTNANWYGIVIGDARSQIKVLQDKSILAEHEVVQSIRVIQQAKGSLATKNLYPVFWDIHHDNLLVDESGKLTGIIDFEHIKYAALDYPLSALRKLVTQPWKFATEDNEKYAKVEDYRSVWEWYQQYYPEMFAFGHQDERIKIYQLLDCLGLLEEWSHDKELTDTFQELIR